MNRSESYLTADRLARLENQLTAQDRRVIETVATVHLASGDQLARACFPERDLTDSATRRRHARRRLARLSELGLLSRLARRVGGIRAGSAGFVYTLAPAGQRLAAGWRGANPGRGRQPHEPGRSYADHRLAVSEVFARLVEASHEDGARLLSFEAEPECWRSFAAEWGHARRLKPDAFAAIGVKVEELLWLIEVDRGTVSAAALKHQVLAYLAYWRSGHRRDTVMPRVLWLVPNATRRATVEAIVTASGAPSGLFLVAPIVDAIDCLTDHSSGGSAS